MKGDQWRDMGVALSELLRWETDDGSIVAEVDDDIPGGFQAVSLGADGIYEARIRFEKALENVRGAAEKALRIFRDDLLDPDGVEIEFGVKLKAAAGAILAKASSEAHLTVKLSWSKPA
jgi:hypothetical protein